MGVVTSLGMEAIQINSGLSHSTEIPTGTVPTAIIIAIITIIFIISALTGVSKGIKNLSLVNVTLMIILLLFSFIFSTALGGTAIYLDLFTNTAIGETVKKRPGFHFTHHPGRVSNHCS